MNIQRPIQYRMTAILMVYITINTYKNAPILYWKFDVGRWTFDVRKPSAMV